MISDIVAGSENWPILLPAQKLEMDRELEYTSELNSLGPVTHIRLNIYPDGGVSTFAFVWEDYRLIVSGFFNFTSSQLSPSPPLSITRKSLTAPSAKL